MSRGDETKGDHSKGKSKVIGREKLQDGRGKPIFLVEFFRFEFVRSRNVRHGKEIP